MQVSRRSLITGIGCIIAAPAIVRASSLMKVKAVPYYWDAAQWEALQSADWFAYQRKLGLSMMEADDDITSWTPNAETIAAMKECREGNLRRFANVEELLAELRSEEQ